MAVVKAAQRLEQNSAVVEGRVLSSSSRALSKAAQATGKAKVTYLPEDPQVSRVTDFAILPYQILIGLGGVMTLAGLSCLGHVMKFGRKTLADAGVK
jgi:hypothetical protein